LAIFDAMILGMPVSTFTLIHVLISLVGILTGVIVVFGLCGNRRLTGWTGVFLITTLLTSLTGFLFPIKAIGPPHIVGVISLLLLVPCLLGIYAFKLAGNWRWIYVITAVAALYLNVFVGVVQAFQKIGFLHTLAPRGNEPPFAVAQGIVLVLFIVLAVLGVRKFRPRPVLTF
jgi:hypothetical protein